MSGWVQEDLGYLFAGSSSTAVVIAFLFFFLTDEALCVLVDDGIYFCSELSSVRIHRRKKDVGAHFISGLPNGSSGGYLGRDLLPQVYINGCWCHRLEVGDQHGRHGSNQARDKHLWRTEHQDNKVQRPDSLRESNSAWRLQSRC